MRSAIFLLAMVAGLGTVSAQGVFVVYKLSASYEKIGPGFSSSGTDSAFQENQRFNGVFLYDSAAGEGAIVWTSRNGKLRVMRTRDFGATLLNYRAQGGTSLHDVYALNEAFDADADASNDFFRTIFLVGERARRVEIGGGNNRTLASKLNGSEWLTNTEGESLAFSKISLRYSPKDTVAANTTLTDAPGTSPGLTIADLRQFWVRSFIAKGFQYQGPESAY